MAGANTKKEKDDPSGMRNSTNCSCKIRRDSLSLKFAFRFWGQTKIADDHGETKQGAYMCGKNQNKILLFLSRNLYPSSVKSFSQL